MTEGENKHDEEGKGSFLTKNAKPCYTNKITKGML